MIRVEKSADLFEFVVHMNCVCITKIARQNETVPTFLQRTLRDVEEPKFVPDPTLLEALGNVCRH